MKESRSPKQKGTWTGPERRSEPRTFKRNVGLARRMIASIAVVVTIGGWLAFALTPVNPTSPPIANQQVVITPTSPVQQPATLP
ncbi:MAG TPA: hypothetical protein VLQ48_01955 [Chloroflexia bacterium]|nr:hypothetical protein [Chloroflexia bacterium]